MSTYYMHYELANCVQNGVMNQALMRVLLNRGIFQGLVCEMYLFMQCSSSCT